MDSRDRLTKHKMWRERQEKIVPWQKKFHDITGYWVPLDDFLGLDETATLRSVFFERVSSAPTESKAAWNKDWKSQLFERIAALKDKILPQSVTLFHHDDSVLGAARVPGDLVLQHCAELWGLTSDDLAFSSVDMRSGFCLEQNYYDVEGNYCEEGVFELTTWGEFTISP